MIYAVVSGIGVTELLIVLGIVLIIFGPKRLPMLGRQLGSGMREFKDSITRRTREEEDGDDRADAGDRAELEPPASRAAEAEPLSGETVAERDR